MSYLQTQIENLLRLAQAKSAEEPYYEVLESITFNGTQMFWLPVKPALDVKIDITFKSDNYASTSCLFGGRINASGSNRKMFAFWQCVGGSSARPDDGYMRADLSNSSTGTGDIGKANSTSVWTNIVKDGIYNYLNGVLKVTQTAVTSEFYDDTNTYIALGCMSNGTVSSYSLSNAFSGDVAQLKIWKAGLQIADYVPALDSQMRPCLYDKISKTFTYAKKISDGTTTYDLEYTRWNKYNVDYIKNDTNSYIKTGVIDENEGLSFEADFTYFSGSGYQYVLGAYGGDSYKNTVLYINSTNSIGAWVNKGYSQTAMLANIVEANARIKCYADTTKSIINKNTATTFVEGTERTGAELYIFRRNGDGGSTQPQTTSNAIIGLHSLKINIGNVIVRDFKPVVWHNGDTTAVACLYDEVYNKMYTNAGTGSFKAYIVPTVTAYTLANGVQNNDYYLAENGTKTVSSDHTSCYTNAIPVKEGDIVEWTVTAEQVSANKRIHGYTTNADIEVGTTGSWVEMLAKIVFSTTSDTTQTVRFTVPSGINYIRLSHANVRESACKITITTIYEVGSNCSVQTATSNYFNSGLYGNEKWNVRLIAFTPTSTTGQLFGVVKGSQYTENLTINSAAATGGGSLSRFDSKVTTQEDVIHMGMNQKSLLQTNRYGLFQDNTTIMSWSNPDTFTTEQPCHICKVNGSTGIRPNGCCYLAIEEDNTLIAEFIPVRNATVTTETGLYDRVSGTLNTGVGTHTFNSLS